MTFRARAVLCEECGGEECFFPLPPKNPGWKDPIEEHEITNFFCPVQAKIEAIHQRVREDVDEAEQRPRETAFWTTAKCRDCGVEVRVYSVAPDLYTPKEFISRHMGASLKVTCKNGHITSAVVDNFPRVLQWRPANDRMLCE